MSVPGRSRVHVGKFIAFALEQTMEPLLAATHIAKAVVRNSDPREEVTEEETIFDSTLVVATNGSQRETIVTRVNQETSDEN